MAWHYSTVNTFKQKASKEEIEKLKEHYNWTPPKAPEVVPIVQYNLKGEIVKVWDNKSQLRRECKYDTMYSVNLCLKHVLGSAYKYVWIYRNELPYQIPNKINVPTHMNWTIDEILIK